MEILEVAQFLGVPLLMAAVVSVLVRMALVLGRRRFPQWEPVLQARLLMVAALAPLTCGIILFAGAVSGWLTHGPQQICLRRLQSGHVSLLLSGLSAMLLIRSVVLATRLIRDFVRAKRYDQTAYPSDRHAMFRVLPCAEPQVFVLGVFNPTIYVSEGLLSAFDEAALQPVLAHEQGHVRRRDPLRRLAASAGLLFYLPGTAEYIKYLIAHTQELAADAEAARQIGDRTRVAEALVRFARLRLLPAAGFEFARRDIEIRVRQLLADDPKMTGPLPAALVSGALALIAIALLSARQLHTLSELILTLP